MKKILVLLMVFAVAMTAFAGGKGEAEAPAAEEAPKTVVEEKVIKNPDTYIRVAYGTIDTLDPAKCYDNVSGGCIQQMYENLIFFDGGSTEKYVPVLSTKVPTAENGLITNGGKTYTFPIRKGVKFHSGNELTAEVVAYSFKRHLVVDPDGGPMWMVFEALFGTYGSREDGKIVLTMDMLDKAIQVKGDSVVFNLKEPFSPFMAILTYVCTVVIDRDFAIANGDWDGTAADIARVNGPEEGQEVLYEIASGTGPYTLGRWEKGVEIVFDRNGGYWGPQPALAKGIYRIVEEWSTRKLLLLQGDADSALVDAMYYEEMNKEKGLKIYKDLTTLGNRGIHFNFDIVSTDNPAIGSGKLDGKGIPPNFFSDKDVRLGLIYAFDKDTYINEIIKRNGIPAATPICAGLPFFNPELGPYPFDLKKAEEYLKKAWGGKVWDTGFEFDMLFNTGNEVRESTCKMLAETVMSMNPKFKINVRGVEWATYVDMQRQRLMPVYYIGWGADYPDPHNFVQPYMHSEGLFAGRCSYKNPEVDKLVIEGVLETNPAKRKEIYYRLQDIYLEDAVGIMLHQPIETHYYKDWLNGYVFHPMENEPTPIKNLSKGY